MKSILLFIVILIFFNQPIFSQSIVQIALDFYSKEILKKEKGITVFYNGKIGIPDSNYEEDSKSKIRDFYSCKMDPRGIHNTEKKITGQDVTYIFEPIDEKFFPITQENSLLKITRPLIKRKKLKWIYIQLNITRIDNIEGQEFYIKIRNNKVIDWCETSWIS